MLNTDKDVTIWEVMADVEIFQGHNLVFPFSDKKTVNSDRKTININNNDVTWIRESLEDVIWNIIKNTDYLVTPWNSSEYLDNFKIITDPNFLKQFEKINKIVKNEYSEIMKFWNRLYSFYIYIYVAMTCNNDKNRYQAWKITFENNELLLELYQNIGYVEAEISSKKKSFYINKDWLIEWQNKFF